MLAFKTAGAVLLLVCGYLCGKTVCRRDDARLFQTEGFISLIKYIRNQIDCFLTPVDKILSGCPENILSACGADAGAPGFAELLAGCELYISGTAEELLGKFARELGNGYRESQIKLCDYYADKLSAERDRLAADLPKRRRVVMTLCMCTAAGVAVILL